MKIMFNEKKKKKSRRRKYLIICILNYSMAIVPVCGLSIAKHFPANLAP